MGDNNVSCTMDRFLTDHSEHPITELDHNPQLCRRGHNYEVFVTVENPVIDNGKVIMPAVPWAKPYEIYGMQSLNQESFLRDLHSRATAPPANAMSRILGVLPTIGFPILESRPVIIETPWFIAKLTFKGDGTVSNPHSMLQCLSIHPMDHTFEVESDEVKDYLTSSFEFDTKHLAEPVPKFSIKNSFMNGMEVSADLKFELATAQLLKFTASAKISSPSFKIFKDLYVTLEFGYDAVIYIKKNGKNDQHNPFNGIQVPQAILLGRSFFERNYEQSISTHWKDLIDIPSFSSKQNNRLWDNNFITQKTNNFNQQHSNTIWNNSYITNRPNNIGNNLNKHNTIWHENPDAQVKNNNHKYVRVMMVKKHEPVITPEMRNNCRQTVGLAAEILPFVYDAAIGVGLAIAENPELLLLFL